MYNIDQLNDKLLSELKEIAETLGIKSYKKLAKEEYVNNIKDLKEKMTILGVPDDKLYTLDSISKIELKHGREKKNQKSAYFGWDGKIKYINN